MDDERRKCATDTATDRVACGRFRNELLRHDNASTRGSGGKGARDTQDQVLPAHTRATTANAVKIFAREPSRSRQHTGTQALLRLHHRETSSTARAALFDDCASRARTHTRPPAVCSGSTTCMRLVGSLRHNNRCFVSAIHSTRLITICPRSLHSL